MKKSIRIPTVNDMHEEHLLRTTGKRYDYQYKNQEISNTIKEEPINFLKLKNHFDPKFIEAIEKSSYISKLKSMKGIMFEFNF